MTMANSTAHDSTPTAAGSKSLYIGAGLGMSLLFYFFSPILLFLAFRLGMPFPGPQVLQILGIVWLPLQWFAESGLPGAAEYVAFLNWIAGNP